MPYISRNPKGHIMAIALSPNAEIRESVPADHPEVLEFLALLADQPDASFLHSDLSLIRVLEDLVNLLVDRGVVQFADFPEAAQRKLLERGRLRARIRDVSLLETEARLF